MNPSKHPAQLHSQPVFPERHENRPQNQFSLRARRAAAILILSAFPCSFFAQQAPARTASDVAGRSGGEEAIQLSVFTVTGDKDEGYRSTQTISGSRTVEELHNIANSISIMNRELIEDLGVTNMSELSAFGITGESEVDPNLGAGQSVFRGIVNPWQLRDGFIWYVVPDAFNIERVELLRGPNAFLYGEAAPGGSKNQMTKRARGTNSRQTRFTVGSFDLHRAELDWNRKLNEKLAVRFNAVAQNQESFVNHAYRKFGGMAVAVRYHPFRNTVVNFSYEYGALEGSRARLSLQNRFDNTAFNGATAVTAAANSGYTYIPALGRAFEMVGTRISAGRNQPVTDLSILSPTLNLVGPSAGNSESHHAGTFTLEQSVGKNLHLELSLSLGNSQRPVYQVGGTKSNGLYLDVMPTLPGGAPNPYFNQYYTEYYAQQRFNDNTVRDIRLAAVYDLQLPFMTQRLLFTGQQHQDNPMARSFGEFVDPTSPNFKGALVNANTVAAHNTNNTVMTNNRFYRRLYVKDGDNAGLTTWTTQPGTVWRHDASSNGGNAGMFSERRFYSPSYGVGSSGSYRNGRIRSMVGWRHDVFDMHIRRVLYNAASDTEYNVPERPTEYTYIALSAWNLGGVFHATKWLSGFFNWAESYRISSGVGADSLKIGDQQGLSTGDGIETGLRWSLLGGKVVSNWTYYKTLMYRDRGIPMIPTAVRDELEAIFVDDFNRDGADTQTLSTSGLEFETTGNLTANWTLVWNLATSRVETYETLVNLRAFHGAAQGKRAATPETDAFLATVVEGTPRPGFTRLRSNLITRYRFSEGSLKGFMIGGSIQYRTQTFLGNFDGNRDGVAEETWGPAYTVWNLMSGYDVRLFKRQVRFTLNVNNLLDEQYYRTSNLTSAAFDPGRTFRLSSSVRF